MAATSEKIKFELTASDQTSQAFNAILGRLDQVDKSAKKSADSIGSLGRNFRGVFAATSVGVVASEFAKLTDTFTNVSARLKNVTYGVSNFNEVQGKLFNMSQSNRTALEQTTDLYSQLARATQGTGIEQQKLLKITDGIGKALIVSGANGQSASAALIQLSQGLAAGALRGQEFLSVQEQAPEILRAVQSGLGLTRDGLKKLADDGKLTTEKFIDGFLKGLPEIERMAANTPTTIGGAFQQVRNAILLTVGEMDKATGTSTKVASGITAVSKAVASLVENKEALAGIAASLGTFAVLGAAAANVGLLTGALGALGAFLLSPAGAVILALAGVAGVASYLSAKADTYTEIRKELELVEARLKSGNMLEQTRNGLLQRRAELLKKIEDESSAEMNRLLRSGTRPKSPETKSKEEIKAGEERLKFMQEWQDKLLEATLGERALFEQKVKSLKFEENQELKLLSIFDSLSAAKQRDKENSNREKQNKQELDAAEKSLNYLDRYREDMAIITEQIALKNDGMYRTQEQQLIENANLQLTKKHTEQIFKIKNLDNLSEAAKLNAIAAANIEYQQQLELVKKIASQRDASQKDLMGGITKGAVKYFDEISNVAAFTEDATTRALRGMEDAFVNMAMTGKLSFKDLANSIISDLIRIQIRQSIVGPLANAMSGFLNPGGYSGMSYTNSNAGTSTGITFDGGGYTGSGARAGGMDGKGGFMAMLHPNETVIDHTKGQGGGVSVNIINNSGSQATAKQTVDSRGNRRIEVMIGDMVAKEISRIGSGANDSIRTTFGASPALAGR